MRIATWNVNSLNARQERVDEWLGYGDVDVALLQETKMSDEQWPGEHFASLGYESVHHGEGRWNGVAILSRVGLDDLATGFLDGGEPDRDARIVTATCGGVRASSVYVPNGRSLDDEHYQYKLAWLARLRAHLDADVAAESQGMVVVGGDFNIAPDDRDVWSVADTSGQTHVSEAERRALVHVCDWGLTDVFRNHYEGEGLYSWWDYRGGNFHKRIGMRIDLLLTSAALTEAATFSLVDRTARKGKQPSDHAPVFVDVALADSGSGAATR